MAGTGCFFLIRGRQSGMCLDVEGSGDAGTPVVLWEETGADNQLWYKDYIDETIRSKCNNLCLMPNEFGTLTVGDFEGNEEQMWKYKTDSGCIRNLNIKDKCVDVAAGETDSGSRVCVFDMSEGENQQFDLEYQPPFYFVILSTMNEKAIEITGRGAGDKLITYDRSDEENQIFYCDENGVLRAKQNDFCWTSSKRTGKSIQMQPEDGSGSQDWTIYRNRIANKNNGEDTVQINDAEDGNSVKVVWDHVEDDGADHQCWTIEYV